MVGEIEVEVGAMTVQVNSLAVVLPGCMLCARELAQ